MSRPTPLGSLVINLGFSTTFGTIGYLGARIVARILPNQNLNPRLAFAAPFLPMGYLFLKNIVGIKSVALKRFLMVAAVFAPIAMGMALGLSYTAALISTALGYLPVALFFICVLETPKITIGF
jgi:hypothetical protein